MDINHTHTAWTVYESPLGQLTLIGSAAGLQHVRFPGPPQSLDPSRRRPGAFTEAISQLDEYFAGDRQTFELDLDLSGSRFQRRAWRALREIGYGRTTSYGQLARELGVGDSPGAPAARKVGWAVAATPTPIIVPCHRVIAAGGALTGYRGGLQRKRALLDLEAGGIDSERLRRHGHEQLVLV
jgi:methylated-DNA-[protein]-cysteine S-methyltransferase